ncbi:MAG: hypothetical protein ACI9A2_000945, partial [Halioglobus sp.]
SGSSDFELGNSTLSLAAFSSQMLWLYSSWDLFAK